MAKVIVHTDNAPKSLAGYSQAVKSGGFVFVAGQGPFDARTGEVIVTLPPFRGEVKV
jgi:2-iminobutanoate/2-iminopropanoate deaminase